MNKPKLVALDFEFKRPQEKDMGLICVSLCEQDAEPETYWLWDGSQKAEFLKRMWRLTKDNSTFVGYSIQQAEARCMSALGIDPNKMVWRDLMLEWRWLRNGDNRYNYGRCIINGFPKFTVPPVARVGKKASQEEIDDANIMNIEYLEGLKSEADDDTADLGMEMAGWTMLDCSYYFGAINFTQYKSALETKRRVRDGIIIKGTPDDIAENKDVIMEYCEADVADLLLLADNITEEMDKVAEEPHITLLNGSIETIYLSEQDGAILKIQRDIGDWAARLAKYGNRGLPMHRNRFDRLLEITPMLQQETKEQWNREHPELPLYRVGLSTTILQNRKMMSKTSPYLKGIYTKDQEMLEAIIEDYVSKTGREWPKTRTGKPDTSKKVMDRFASAENIIKQLQRHTGQLSSLKTYSVNKDGFVEALDYLGSDDRQRPDFGPYGTQTARNGAKAKSFCFLGPHWLRMLIDPPEGKAIVECDYGSQEVFIASSITDDDNLRKTYASQDVYMYYAQLTGMYPANLPIPTEEQRKEEWFKPYKKVRNISKTLNLSMQFGAGAKSVAGAVRDATKDSTISDEQGLEWVDEYRSTYSDYTYMVDQVRKQYKQGKGILLPDGWRMGIDNPSVLSASNVPIQGLGSTILREACKRLDEAGYEVIATLHDAVTVLCDDVDAEVVAENVSKIMKEASDSVLGESGMKVGNPEIIRHGQLWLHSERAQEAWSKLGKYFAEC